MAASFDCGFGKQRTTDSPSARCSHGDRSSCEIDGESRTRRLSGATTALFPIHRRQPRGNGRAIAEKLAGAKRTLFLHGRDREALARTCILVEAKSAKAILLYYDLRRAESIERMVEEIGSEPIDALINNAGIALVKPLDQITLEEWETMFAVNVTAPFSSPQRLLPKMPGGSSIVNILSIAAKTGFPNSSAYCMSKFTLEGFSQAVREEVRPRGIRVLNIYPAATNTEIWNPVEGEWPREKMLRPEEIADAVAYSLSRPADVAVENIALQNVTGSL